MLIKRPIEVDGCYIYSLFPGAFWWSGVNMYVAYYMLSSCHCYINFNWYNDEEARCHCDTMYWRKYPISVGDCVEYKCGTVTFEDIDYTSRFATIKSNVFVDTKPLTDIIMLPPKTLLVYDPAANICIKQYDYEKNIMSNFIPESWFSEQ